MNQDRELVVEEFEILATTGNTLILPAAAVIETGNHIAQLSDGEVRRRRMEALSRILDQSAKSQTPWVVGKADWDSQFIQLLVDGSPDGTIPNLVDLATRGVGVGDASILHEARAYRASTSVPSGQPIRIWTLDAGLRALS
jgi:hypothetical protein